MFSLSSCSYLQWLSLRSKCGISVNFSLSLSLFLVKCIFCYQSKVKPSLAEFTKCLNYVCLNTLNKLKSRSRNIIYKWVKRIILIFQWLRKKVKSEIDIIIKKILINSYSIFCHPLPCNTGRCIICLKNNDNNQNKVIHVEIAFLVVFFFYWSILFYIYIHIPLLWRSGTVAALLEKYVSTFFLVTSKEKFIGGFHAKLVQACYMYICEQH